MLRVQRPPPLLSRAMSLLIHLQDGEKVGLGGGRDRQRQRQTACTFTKLLDDSATTRLDHRKNSHHLLNIHGSQALDVPAGWMEAPPPGPAANGPGQGGETLGVVAGLHGKFWICWVGQRSSEEEWSPLGHRGRQRRWVWGGVRGRTDMAKRWGGDLSEAGVSAGSS